MKELLKNAGIILIIIGVLILSIAVWRENATNTKLVISLVLVVIGLLGHIFVNKFVE